MKTKVKAKKTKAKTKAKSKKKAVKSGKASIEINGHQLKWSEKWQGWEVFRKGRLMQLFKNKEKAKQFASENK